jgi:predicted N-acetyltransferase YhbS
MKLKHLLHVGIVALLGVGAVSARTWTSANGKNTFEGELKSFDKENDKVTIVYRNGRTVTFGTHRLSEADKTFLEENGKAAADAAAPAKVEASLKEQKIGKHLAKKGILSKLEGETFANFQLGKAPEYYLVYFSASW